MSACSCRCTSTSGARDPWRLGEWTDRSNAVVLLSGGLDSYTAAAVAKRDGFTLCALSINYGQRHAQELEAARAVARGARRRAASRARPRSARIGGSALTSIDDRRAEGSPIDPQRHPDHLRAGAQHHLPVARAGLGRSARRGGHLHRRQRARLLRLSRLPARVHPRVRAPGAARDEGRRRRAAADHAHAADRR